MKEQKKQCPYCEGTGDMHGGFACEDCEGTGMATDWLAVINELIHEASSSPRDKEKIKELRAKILNRIGA